MITIALARASRCCLLARLQGAPQHNTAYACSRPSLEVKQLFICLILWVAENVISLYICTQILTIFVPPCEQRTKAKLMKISRDIIRFTMHSLCTFTAPYYYYYYYVLCGPWSVARSWHYLCHTAWLMLKLFFFYLTTRRWQHWVLWCGRQLLVFGNTFLLLY